MAEFPKASTESQLREWRTGQPSAERLAAAILLLDDFEDVDPQAPLGGPDGRKDILCRKGTTPYVAAVYFPTTDKEFGQVQSKFEDDLQGALRYERPGFIFITNQHIRLSDRSILEASAAAKGKLCQLYHRERLRTLLDSPTGYGVRLEFLRIPMSEEEQLAYFAASGNKLEYALERHTREIRNLARRIDTLRVGQDFAVETISRIATRLGEDVAPPTLPATATSQSQLQSDTRSAPMSAALTPAFLLAVHRLVCADMPLSIVGRFRQTEVWIGSPGSPPGEAVYLPPAPDEALRGLDELLAQWNEGFADIATTDESAKLDALARFHYELSALHPFTDGNGRVARAVLIQQCVDILGHVDPALLDRGTDYYLAMRHADAGDFQPLKTLICRAVRL